MRTLKNCKVGTFVRYEETIYQVNCFYKSGRFGKLATLVEVKPKNESAKMKIVSADSKVEYIGEICQVNGTWYKKTVRQSPFYD